MIPAINHEKKKPLCQKNHKRIKRYLGDLTAAVPADEYDPLLLPVLEDFARPGGVALQGTPHQVPGLELPRLQAGGLRGGRVGLLLVLCANQEIIRA